MNFKMMFPISDGSGTQNPGFVTCKCLEEIGLRQVDQGFSSFFVKKFGQKMKKIFAQLGLKTHIFRVIPKNPIAATRSITSIHCEPVSMEMSKKYWPFFRIMHF